MTNGIKQNNNIKMLIVIKYVLLIKDVFFFTLALFPILDVSKINPEYEYPKILSKKF